MAKQGDVHVVWDADDKNWRVEVTGQTRASGLHETKQPAVEQARRISDRNHSELYVHGQDGRIQRRDSHGHDPFPPRG